MSPSWRDQVRLFLSPERIVAVRLARGLRPAVLAREALPVAGEGDDPRPMLAALRGLLADPGWQRADATVLLSSRCVHYQLLPWTDAVLDREEEAARVRRLYGQAHGDAAAALELRTSAGGFGAASVASGVRRELLAGLQEAFAASTLRLASVQPYVMAAFNEARRGLRRGAHWFAVVESGTLVSALVEGGRWTSLRTRRVAGDWHDELLMALHRQAVSQAGAEDVRSVVIHAADEGRAQWPAAQGWSFRQLDLPSAQDPSAGSGRPWGLALAGAS